MREGVLGAAREVRPTLSPVSHLKEFGFFEIGCPEAYPDLELTVAGLVLALNS